MKTLIALLVAFLAGVAQAQTCQPADCNDGNPCTSDICSPAGLCQHMPLDGPCDDQDPCTSISWCTAGTCLGVPDVVCPEDQSPCTYASCIPRFGCSQQPLPDGLACNDGRGCTRGDTCLFGACVGTPVVCEPSDPCQMGGVCDEATGACANAARPDGWPCDDASDCTTDDACQAGVCRGGSRVDCDDANPCTIDLCDALTGCSHDPTTTCDDGNACTIADTCSDGACHGGPAVDCDDGNRCTEDTCYPAAGCVNALDPACDGDPLGLGYWKRLCQGPIEGEKLTLVDVACVSRTCTFASVTSLAAICERLYAKPAQDDCEKGEAQLMALTLNSCRGRASDPLPIDAQCRGLDLDTVRAARAEVDRLLCDPARTADTCESAECLAEAISSGRALR
jgi:slime mold repeat-containing protein